MKVREETVSATPVNAMGASSSVPGSGNIATFDPLLKNNGKKKLRDILRRPTKKVRTNGSV